jgi:DNA-binding PadR family transcriptional regulator
MLVLGVVRIFQPVHGYDVRRELITWHAEEWGNVAPGSIYNALKTLVKEEMIEIASTEHVGGRPERTSYRLTPRGERELNELLRDALWTVKMPVDPLVAVVSVMGFLKRDELIAALEARSAQIAGAIAHAEHAIVAVDDVETPAHVREMLRLLNARMGSELAWSKDFVGRLRAGDYDTADDVPWREQAAARREATTYAAKRPKPASKPASKSVPKPAAKATPTPTPTPKPKPKPKLKLKLKLKLKPGAKTRRA